MAVAKEDVERLVALCRDMDLRCTPFTFLDQLHDELTAAGCNTATAHARMIRAVANEAALAADVGTDSEQAAALGHLYGAIERALGDRGAPGDSRAAKE
jgi:hypothetical protein